MIIAPILGRNGMLEAVSVAETGATTYKPTVFGTALGVYDHQDVDTESLGNATLTLTNVVVNSRYRVELESTGALVVEGTAASSTVSLTIPVYGMGSASNDLVVKVRKSSAAPKYQPFESFITLGLSGGSIYVAQVPDNIA